MVVSVTDGASSISFGLPVRSLVDRVFLAMAVAPGAICPIVGPLDVNTSKALAACGLLMGRDEYAQRFLGVFERDGRFAREFQPSRVLASTPGGQRPTIGCSCRDMGASILWPESGWRVR